MDRPTKVTAAAPISICYIRSQWWRRFAPVTAAAPISICYIGYEEARKDETVTAAAPISICYIQVRRHHRRMWSISNTPLYRSERLIGSPV
jgi:hypothetical protein